MNSELKSERINDLAFVDDLQNLYDQMGKNIDRNVQSLEHNDKENTEPYLDQHLKLLGSGLKASANIQQSIWKEIQLVNKMGFQFNEMQNQLSRKAKGLVRLKQQMEELCSEEQLLNKKLGLLMSSDYKSKTILKKKILQYQKNLVESQDKISSLMLHLKESQDEIENVKKISQKLKFELDQKNEEIIALTKKTQWLQNRVNEENDIKKHRESEEESSKLLIKQIQLENSELKKKIEGLKIKMRGVNEV
ncbi:MAG: hypothetical protein KDD50_13270, partial [Bdellovibrionales bacterium]|nr:hypothetical protein [Bdellovibrionales bacterium]